MPDSQVVERVLDVASGEAKNQHSPVLGTPHLFIALTKLDGTTASTLRRHGHDPKQVRDALRTALGLGDAPADSEPQLSKRAAANLRLAVELAETAGTTQIEERHILSVILGDDTSSFTLRVLRSLEVDVEALLADQASATPILDRLGRDLTALAQQGALDPLIGRKEQLRQLARTLIRKKKNNPVLVGPAGVGKTAIVEGLAARIAAGTVPNEIRNKRLVELPTASLVSGTIEASSR